MPTTTPAPILQDAALLQRFQALDSFLIEHQALWRPRPFVHYPALPWEANYPQLVSSIFIPVTLFTLPSGEIATML